MRLPLPPTLAAVTAKQLRCTYTKTREFSPDLYGYAILLVAYGAEHPLPMDFLVKAAILHPETRSGEMFQALLAKGFLRFEDRFVYLDLRKFTQIGIKVPSASKTKEAIREAIQSLQVDEIPRLQEVLKSYNKARKKLCDTQGEQFHGDYMLSGSDRVRSLHNVQKFLDGLGVTPTDYTAYFYAMFCAGGWRRVPSLHRCLGPSAADAWMNNRDEALEMLGSESLSVRTLSEVSSPWRDLNPKTEETKKKLISTGLPAICISRIQELNGYHPRSEVCISCSKAEDCRRVLVTLCDGVLPRPDLLFAVRRGEVSLDDLFSSVPVNGQPLNPMRPPWRMIKQTATVPA
jgi:hypothetical protein